jgi:alcohol dehydrogenase (cytochrome c)
MDGLERKVICWPNRNGFYYVLDRITGQFLLGTPFVEINWADKGLSSQGRPIPLDANAVIERGRLTKPGNNGAVNWQPAAFNPALGLIFVNATESQSVFTKSAAELARGTTGMWMGSGVSVIDPVTQTVRALDAASGAKRWEYHAPLAKGTGNGGMLATAGGLVFGTSGGSLFALDAATGEEFWSVSLGDTHAPPISITSEGRQVIAVLAGQAMFLFGL